MTRGVRVSSAGWRRRGPGALKAARRRADLPPVEGVQGALTRVAELQARIAVLNPVATGATRRAATTSTAASSFTSTADGFSQALASATGATATAPLTPARKLAPGQYGSLQPPAELAGYGNGRVPTDRLQSLGVGGHKLWAPAATAFSQMKAAATADGVTIGVNDSYRDLAAQQRMAREKGLYSQGGLAAAPGTSNHGWGVAVDLQLDARAQAWMRDNGWRYGFVEDVPREPWHWTYRPAS